VSALPPLASATDLAARMAVPPAPPERIDAALADASAVVRAYAGQTFTLLTTTDPLTVFCCDHARLVQRPVHDVSDVTDPYGSPLAYEWHGTDRLVVITTYRTVWVTYDHGYDDADMPGDVVAVVCNVAARTLGNPPEEAGVASRSITNYSETLGPVAAAGPVGLFNDEKALLDRYRRVGGSAQVCRA
jgi:YD repeat-containing protein